MQEVFEEVGEGERILAMSVGHKETQRLEIFPPAPTITFSQPQRSPWYTRKQSGRNGWIFQIAWGP